MEGVDAEEGVTACHVACLDPHHGYAVGIQSILRTSPCPPEQAAVRSLGWAERVAGRTERAIDGS
jgi:hypothetical protein